MAVTNELVRTLRKITNAGIMDCKNALLESKGDMDKAKTVLREKGILKMASREGMLSNEGQVGSYIHPGGKIGVLVEIACETDFVARSEQFRQFAHEVALQIAASAPQYVSDSEIPESVLQHEADIAKARAIEEGKSVAVAEKATVGRVNKFKDEVCLMRQTYIRDESLTIEKLLHQVVASTGENVLIRRFARWELGEASGSQE